MDIILFQLQDVKSQLVQAAPSANSFLIICYCLLYLYNKRSCFIVAFLLCEALAISVIMDFMSNPVFYLFFAFYYSIFYFYICIKNDKLTTLFACVLIILNNLTGAIDAFIYPETETVFSQNYVAIVVCVHFYLITTLVRWQSLRSTMGKSIMRFYDVFCLNYNLKLF